MAVFYIYIRFYDLSLACAAVILACRAAMRSLALAWYDDNVVVAWSCNPLI
jgi:hypothetical protein